MDFAQQQGSICCVCFFVQQIEGYEKTIIFPLLDKLFVYNRQYVCMHVRERKLALFIGFIDGCERHFAVHFVHHATKLA